MTVRRHPAATAAALLPERDHRAEAKPTGLRACLTTGEPAYSEKRGKALSKRATWPSKRSRPATSGAEDRLQLPSRKRQPAAVLAELAPQTLQAIPLTLLQALGRRCGADDLLNRARELSLGW
jgi:hypothetical protein